MAEIAGLTLSALSIADLLIQCGHRIYTRVSSERELTQLVLELKMLEVEDGKNELADIVQLAQKVLNDPLVEPARKERLKRTWEKIRDLMVKMDALLEDLIRYSSILDTWSRRKAKRKLQRLGGTGEPRTLRNRFRDDVSVLRELQRDNPWLFLSHRDFNPIGGAASTEQVSLAKGKLVKPKHDISKDPRWYFWEPKPYVSNDKEEVQESIAILAQALDKVQPGNGILKLVGFREEVGSAYQLVFYGPFDSGALCPTLSKYLLDNPAKPTLNFRVDLCYQLANAVCQTQVVRLVHKNIRPENILVHPFADCPSPTARRDEKVPALSLCGWQFAREVEDAHTRLSGDVTLQRKIYQHPERQIEVADYEYSMAHDVYSLGVCMLEILCWQSVLRPVGPFVSQSFVDTFESLDFQPYEGGTNEDRYARYPNNNKAVLVAMAERFIPTEAGARLSRMVCGFLKCLDTHDVQGEEEAPDEYVLVEEGDRRQAAINFLDTAVTELRNIQGSI